MARRRYWVKVTQDVAYNQEIVIVAEDMHVVMNGTAIFTGEHGDSDQIAALPRGKWLGVQSKAVSDDTAFGVERWQHMPESPAW